MKSQNWTAHIWNSKHAHGEAQALRNQILDDSRWTTSTRPEDQNSSHEWSPPPVGSVMINVDAAIFFQHQRAGIGVVIRNHLGQVLAACRRFVEHTTEAEMGEAIAMRHALLFAEQTGFQNVTIVSSDCSSLISKVKNTTYDKSHTCAIVFDIKSRAPKIKSCIFTHVFSIL